jgi:hypothetical protein
MRKPKAGPIKIQRHTSKECGALLRQLEEFFASGHPNILATHPATFEVTKDPHLTERGDCVIGVNASKGPRDFAKEFKRLCQHDDAKIQVDLSAGGIIESIRGMGNAKLTFTHPSECVGRKSIYASNRTVVVKADKAACDLNRELVDLLTSRETRLRVLLTVEL